MAVAVHGAGPELRQALDGHELTFGELDVESCRRVAGGGRSLVLVLELPRDAAFATLTRELAIEHGRDGVRVNAVWAPDVPVDEVADAVRYLATAGFVTGTVLTLDGGRSVAAFGAL
jgi:hypothetical protein